MADTSYNPTFAPYPNWSLQQAPVPASVHNLPSSIAANGSVQTSLIVTEGFSLISAGLTASQSGTMSVQRYLDAGGTVPQGAALGVPLSAGVAGNIDILDGRPFASFKLTVTNGSGSSSTLTNFALLLQLSGTGTPDGIPALDGSGTIATGGTAQNLFGGAAPANGFAVYNPDASNYLWVSDSATAAANGAGSIPVPPLGGYETPTGMKPVGKVTIVGANSGQKFTARSW